MDPRLSFLVPLLLAACGDKTDDTAPPTSDDPCPVLHLSATALSWAGVPPVGAEPRAVTVTNLCSGSSELVLAPSLAAGSSAAFAFELGDSSLAPGETTELVVSFEPGDLALHSATLQVASNAREPSELAVSLEGQAVGDADGDGFDSEAAGGDDCDDSDPDIFPGATELWYDGVDADCSGGSDFDQDGDGHDSDLHAGGGDCDDTDASVHPGADDPWYDGVDADCGGEDDFDQDGDGDPSDAWGGGDCDDSDPGVYYDSGEVDRDGADDDCDGWVDEDWVAAGDLIVSELMVAPAAVEDGLGEWLELYNTSGGDIDIINWALESDDGHGVVVGSSLVVPAGGRVVLGASADVDVNGGAAVDYAYDHGSFGLADEGDDLRLMLGELEVFGLAYDATWALEPGASISLDAALHSAEVAADAVSWCPGMVPFGAGDLGTPGAVNGSCDDYDYDGDGFSVNDGDCGEHDASVYPDAPEVWDALDNDCNGVVDDMHSGSATAWLDGPDDVNLGHRGSLALGDLDGDGALDIVAGSYYAEQDWSYEGGVWLVSGAGWAGLGGPIDEVAHAWIEGGFYYNLAGRLDPRQGDLDGDGVDDLFLISSDESYAANGNVAGGVFFGGGGLFGDRVLEDADVVLRDCHYRQSVPSNHLDLDADGLADLLYGDAFYASYVSATPGTVYGFLGSSLAAGGDYDLQDDADFALDGAANQDSLGWALGGGDLDGDGFDDLLVAAPWADRGASDSGSVLLLRGSGGVPASGVLADSASLELYGARSDDGLGAGSSPQVADFDGDGALDIAVGAYLIDTVYLWLDAGSLSGAVSAASADIAIVGVGPDHFGLTLGAGDLDADGIQDLLVGAPDHTSPYQASLYADEPGELFIFAGASLDASVGSSAHADVSILGEGSFDLFGAALATGDLSGDGTDDLLVAAPSAGSADNGSVRIFESP